MAADGVATSGADATGNVLDSTPVDNNLFASRPDLPAGATAAIRTLDAPGMSPHSGSAQGGAAREQGNPRRGSRRTSDASLRLALLRDSLLAGDQALAVEEAGDDAPGGDVGGEQRECEADRDRDGRA